MMDIIHLNKDNRMLRIGFGKHERKWFARVDLWFIGIRIDLWFIGIRIK